MKLLFWKKEKYSKIKLGRIVFLGWRNLRANRTRSVLTVGGVALGIGIISFLLCIGFGIQGLIIDEVTKNHPRDILDINNGNLDNFVALDNTNMEKIRSIEGVAKIEREVNTGGKVSYESSQVDAVVYGSNQDYLDLAIMPYKKGEKEYDNQRPNVIISTQLARLIGFKNPNDAMGKIIKLDVVASREIHSKISEETTFEVNEVEVVGLMNSDNSFVRIPFEFMKNNLGIDLAQSGKILATDLDKIKNIEQEVQHIGFLTESINEIIEDINSFFVVIRVVLIVLGTIIMSISAMGMLNTLSVSLLQRTKEVGILKALGAKRVDIFKMFIFEAIIISIVGGVTGLFGGYGFAVLINKVLIHFAAKQDVYLSSFVSIPYFFVIALVTFILFLGLATGVMPAYRAAKIHALDALRYE
ncbi:MAG: FtsX-like permease family protein [Patescibacteria group bacterium]|nr:FtsX-like permease family protein [Patescibacteria group bacterium]